MPFQPGNSEASKGQKAKPFRDALRLQIAEAGDNFKALRPIAAALIAEASSGNVNAIKELADRLDGKVPQAIVGDDEHGPIQVAVIKYTPDDEGEK